MTDTITNLKEILLAALEAEDPRVQERQFSEKLAQCLIDGVALDESALEEMALALYPDITRVEAPPRHLHTLLAWMGIMGNVQSFVQDRQVALTDGRVACEDGWDYSNVEPGRKVPGLS